MFIFVLPWPRCSWARSACGPWWRWLTVPTAAAWLQVDLVPTTATMSWRAVWPTRLTSTLSGDIWQVGSKHTFTHNLMLCAEYNRIILPVYYMWNLSLSLHSVSPVFVETMMGVVDRFDGPTGVDSVVLSLPNRISEAIFTMTNNIETINNKVRAHMYTAVYS